MSIIISAVTSLIVSTTVSVSMAYWRAKRQHKQWNTEQRKKYGD